MSLNLDAPPLQFTDAAARALGQEFNNTSLGGLWLARWYIDKAFYNLSYQLGRRSNDLRTLLNTDAAGLITSGIAPDSAARRAVAFCSGSASRRPPSRTRRITPQRSGQPVRHDQHRATRVAHRAGVHVLRQRVMESHVAGRAVP